MHENKKICGICNRKRKLGKFGILSRNPDGKNNYCRDCMKNIRDKYRKSTKGRIVQLKSINVWKKKNKKAIKEYNKEYYKRKKHIILYNKKARETTECVLIIENPKKNTNKKINKSRNICIEINPKRKINDT